VLPALGLRGRKQPRARAPARVRARTRARAPVPARVTVAVSVAVAVPVCVPVGVPVGVPAPPSRAKRALTAAPSPGAYGVVRVRIFLGCDAHTNHPAGPSESPQPRRHHRRAMRGRASFRPSRARTGRGRPRRPDAAGGGQRRAQPRRGARGEGRPAAAAPGSGPRVAPGGQGVRAAAGGGGGVAEGPGAAMVAGARPGGGADMGAHSEGSVTANRARQRLGGPAGRCSAVPPALQCTGTATGTRTGTGTGARGRARDRGRDRGRTPLRSRRRPGPPRPDAIHRSSWAPPAPPRPGLGGASGAPVYGDGYRVAHAHRHRYGHRGGSVRPVLGVAGIETDTPTGTDIRARVGDRGRSRLRFRRRPGPPRPERNGRSRPHRAPGPMGRFDELPGRGPIRCRVRVLRRRPGAWDRGLPRRRAGRPRGVPSMDRVGS